jgi:hypothetical protein
VGNFLKNEKMHIILSANTKSLIAFQCEGGIVNQAMIAETSFCAAGTNASIGSAVDCLETIHEGCSPSPISPSTMPNRLADQRNMSKVEPKLAQKPSDAIRNNKRNLLGQTKKWMSFSLGSPPTINEVSRTKKSAFDISKNMIFLSKPSMEPTMDWHDAN